MSAPVNHVSRPVEHQHAEHSAPPPRRESEHKAAESKPAEHVGRKVDVKA
jgi:hypothetical protein